MRILHIADLHLGRNFDGKSLENCHAEILDQIFDVTHKRKPDAIIIAGDIYDRSLPPQSSIKQFNEFIANIYHKTNSAIILIAGNHDGGDVIENNSSLANPDRVLIRGSLSNNEKPLILKDEHGKVAFSALPYGKEFIARECFDSTDINNPSDVLEHQIKSARKNIPENTRWVVVAHAFVTGGNPSESERPLMIGGIETVSANLFKDAHYVALGHLHRPQKVKEEHIRYSGSPLAFSFDESNTQKTMCWIELDADGKVIIEEIPFDPSQKVCVIKGNFSDILSKAKDNQSDDFLKFILTDENIVIDPMGRLREHYPNALQIIYEKEQHGANQKVVGAAQGNLDKPMEIINEFFQELCDEKMTEEQEKLITDSINVIEARDNS